MVSMTQPVQLYDEKYDEAIFTNGLHYKRNDEAFINPKKPKGKDK